jgi:FMN phosphatase YigB (HAD superfamily)
VINTLLFDLDDTLLGNDMGTFLPAYLQGVARHFPPGFDARQIAAVTIAGTRAAVANTDPTRRLFDLFDECFSTGTGLATAEWLAIFDRYYETDYRRLEALTQRRPAARAALAWALEQGYEVVIATSPLFGLPPIRERLRWAGLDDLPLRWITSIETSHFAKPHPEFYAELLARLGRRPEQCLMVGNDWTNDITAAGALGLATYWVTRGDGAAPGPNAEEALGLAAAAPAPAAAPPVGSGTLDDFAAWIVQALGPAHEPAHLPEVHSPPGALPYRLTGNLAGLLGELDGLPAEAWRQRPGPGEWSLTELVCHLRDVEREVNLPRQRAVVETDNPFVAGADTDPWAVERDYQSQSGPEALAAFTQARREAAAYLARQPETIWARTARHAIFGPTRLSEMVGWVLDHDLIHLDQVRATRRRISA